MILRALRPSERVIVAAFFSELDLARADKDDRRCRNAIYYDVARRCGVTYDRVLDLCHRRLYVADPERPGVHLHGWNTGVI